MNTRRLRLVRPRWTMGTLLLIVGWSALVVWLNVRPRVVSRYAVGDDSWAMRHAYFEWGYPWSYAGVSLSSNKRLKPPPRLYFWLSVLGC